MNDTPVCPSLAARKALLHRLVDNIGLGSDARAGLAAIYRELEAMRLGSLEQAHARLDAKRLGLWLREDATALPDLSVLDYSGA